VATNIVNQYMPLPNTSGTTNYTGASLGNLAIHQGIARVDQYISPKDQLFAHVILGHRNFPDTALDPNFRFTGDYSMSNYQLQYIHTFSPALLNELRLGADLENVAQLSTRTNTNFTIESLGINGMLIGGAGGAPAREERGRLSGHQYFGLSGHGG
jgi:hypothetical protein